MHGDRRNGSLARDAAMEFGLLNLFVLFVYLGAMLGIGLLFARRQKNTEDFFLAGRRMPWIVVAMSMYASLTSAVICSP